MWLKARVSCTEEREAVPLDPEKGGTEVFLIQVDEIAIDRRRNTASAFRGSTWTAYMSTEGVFCLVSGRWGSLNW